MRDAQSEDSASHQRGIGPDAGSNRGRREIASWGGRPGGRSKLAFGEDDFAKLSADQLSSNEMTPSESSAAANHLRHSASPSLSHKRPFSPAEFDYVRHQHSNSTGLSGAAASPPDSMGHAQLHRKKQTRQARAGRLGLSAHSRSLPVSGHARAQSAGKHDLSVAQREARQAHVIRPMSSETGLARLRDNNRTPETEGRMKVDFSTQPRESADSVRTGIETPGKDFSLKEPKDPPGMFLQPETYPITEEQLVNEVRGIYAGLVMVEKKCIEIDQQQSEAKNELTLLQWQALFALHRQLLHEHHDFFLASQHPSASEALKKLAHKYAMPARMWRYGIHSFLELLRHKLPQSLEHMLRFIFFAYSMITLLLESVPTFDETWAECLGDLARYRMAVEEADMRDRETFSRVAWYWYTQAADKAPEIGRIQHHLAVLARPDIIQQLFYYTKSLISVVPFVSTRDSILLLFGPLLNQDPSDKEAWLPHGSQPSVFTAFVTAHGWLFTQGVNASFISSSLAFLSNLDNFIRRSRSAFVLHSAYICSCNFAAMFEYGKGDAGVTPDSRTPQQPNIDGLSRSQRYQIALQRWQLTDVEETNGTIDIQTDETVDRATSPTILHGSYLACSTLFVILGWQGDKNVLPALHFSLAFLWCQILNLDDRLTLLERAFPWTETVTFLNAMIRSGVDARLIEPETFPLPEPGTKRQLPEDFLIRGLAWSKMYFPSRFFEGSLTEDDGRLLETPSVSIARAQRCLWLGVRLAQFNRWIVYDPSTKRFAPTQLASAFDRAEGKFGPFSQLLNARRTGYVASDVKMQHV